MKKEEITNNVLTRMSMELTNEQLNNLKVAMTIVLYQVDIVEKETHLSTMRDDNDYYVGKFEATLKIQGKSERTTYNYRNSTRKFLDIINKNFRDVEADDINYYLTMLIKKGTLSATSLDNERKYISAFFKWCTKNDYIMKNPFDKIEPIKRIEKKKEILTDEEIEKMRDVCKNNRRELALVDYLLATGVRVSECSKAKLSNLDMQESIINIYGEKTGKWREVYLDTKANIHLNDYITERNSRFAECYKRDYLFLQERGNHDPMSPYCINKMLKNIAKRAGVQKHCTCHLFRKTLASRLSANGMSSQKIALILGNSTAVSEKYYILIPTKDIKDEYYKCMR